MLSARSSVCTTLSVRGRPATAGEQHVCRFIATGRFRSCNYLVMQLLGQNLSEVRRARPEGLFSASTTALLGLQMLQAIENVHRQGYLHRDVKPVALERVWADPGRTKV